MLIYNHNKEFIGIDAEDLEQLGYKSLGNFLDDYDDFADLFVKKPGFIHNFKNFPWIDFVLHAEAEESKAIIKTEDIEFTCDLVITTFFLADSSNQEAYAVSLKHIRDVIGGGGGNDTYGSNEHVQNNERVVLDIDDDMDIGSLGSLDSTILNEPDLLDIPNLEIPTTETNYGENSYNDMDLAFPDLDDTFDAPKKSQTQDIPMLGDSINQSEANYLANLTTSKDYVFNPQVASDELGLPVDLIEEFIGDFIQQSHEFKDKLFDVTLKEDYEEVHALSHKLKGVAANLRIEDSFEVLSIINNSKDQTEIEANLKQFYRLIAKLEGKEAPEFEIDEAEGTLESNNSFLDDGDDIYDFDLLLDDEIEQDKPVAKAQPVEDNFDLDLLSDPEPVAKAQPVEDNFDLDLLSDPEPVAKAQPVEDDFNLDLLSDPEPVAKAQPVEDDFDLDLLSDPEPVAKAQPVEDDFNLDLLSDPEPVAKAQPVETSKVVLHYNPKIASLELGLNHDFVTELIDDFSVEAKDFHQQLITAVESKDYDNIKEIATELKGASDNLRIIEVSVQLQNIIQNNNAEKSIKELYDLIDQL